MGKMGKEVADPSYACQLCGSLACKVQTIPPS